MSLRRHVEKLQADIIQVIETRHTDNVAESVVDELVKLANLVVMATNLLPKVIADNLKYCERDKCDSSMLRAFQLLTRSRKNSSRLLIFWNFDATPMAVMMMNKSIKFHANVIAMFMYSAQIVVSQCTGSS